MSPFLSPSLLLHVLWYALPTWSYCAAATYFLCCHFVKKSGNEMKLSIYSFCLTLSILLQGSLIAALSCLSLSKPSYHKHSFLVSWSLHILFLKRLFFRDVLPKNYPPFELHNCFVNNQIFGSIIIFFECVKKVRIFQSVIIIGLPVNFCAAICEIQEVKNVKESDCEEYYLLAYNAM